MMKINRIKVLAVLSITLFIILFVPFIDNFSDETNYHEADTQPPSDIRYARLLERYLDTLQTRFDTLSSVGAALAVVYENKPLLIRTFGVKVAGTTDSVDEHTVFRLASVSKGFAGVLACMLEQDSIIDMDDKIIRYLPTFRLKDTANTNQLNIRHVLSHTSGLAPHSYDILAEEGIPLSVIIDEFDEVEITALPGELYSYQNAIFSLVDSVFYIATKRKYHELLEKRIFRPLKMRDASCGEEIFTDEHDNVAFPHAMTKKGIKTLTPDLGYYEFLPAAGVNASITDMTRWLIALLGYKPNVISEDIIRTIETPLIETPLKRQYTVNWDSIASKYYSLGWRIYYYKNRKIIYHGGFVQGYRAEIAFCREENVGIVFLQNSSAAVAAVSIPLFFNMWFEENSPGNFPRADLLFFPSFEPKTVTEIRIPLRTADSQELKF